MSAADRREAWSHRTSVALPIILLGILIYCCYVFIRLVAIEYLIEGGRGRAAAAVLTLFFVLIFLSVASYLRLLQTRWASSDYLPKGPYEPDARLLDAAEGQSQVSGTASKSKKAKKDLRIAFQITPRYIVRGAEIPPQGLEAFFTKEVFICDSWGLPLWCNACAQWKPDRCHHFSDAGRCARRGDHYCVWVGGMVSESNNKFFVQFCFWIFMFLLHMLITSVVLISEGKEPSQITQWAIMIGISGFFTIFAGCMVMVDLYFAVQNITTVDNLDKARTDFIAVHIRTTTSDDPLGLSPGGHTAGYALPNDPHTPTEDGVIHPWPSMMLPARRPGGTNPNAHFRTITYPLPQRTPANRANDSSQACLSWPEGTKRTFAILKTSPGDNLWDLGWRANLTSLMGYGVVDWLLPLHRSPFTNNKFSSMGTEFEYGKVLQKVQAQAGVQGVVFGLRSKEQSGHLTEATDQVQISEWEGQSVHVPASSRSPGLLPSTDVPDEEPDESQTEGRKKRRHHRSD